MRIAIIEERRMNHEWRFLRENEYGLSEFYCIHCLTIFVLRMNQEDGIRIRYDKDGIAVITEQIRCRLNAR